MRERDRFDQILIKHEIAADRTPDLRNFDGVRQTGAIIISSRIVKT